MLKGQSNSKCKCVDECISFAYHGQLDRVPHRSWCVAATAESRMSQRYIPSTPPLLLCSSTKKFPSTWYMSLEVLVVTTESLELNQSPEPATVQQPVDRLTHRRAVDVVFIIRSSITMLWLTTALSLKFRP